MLDLGVLELEFENSFVIFEINTLEFVLLKKFGRKTKMHKIETKNALFGYF